MSRNLLFVAISRTGNDPLRHETFEIAAILRRPGAADVSLHWAIRPEHLEAADDAELRRTRYLERREAWEHNNEPVVSIDPNLGNTIPTTRRAVADKLASIMVDAHLVTIGRDREPEFLREFLRKQGFPCPHLGHLDVTAHAAGAMFGWAQGWHACAQTSGAAVANRVDFGPELPYDPFWIARALGLVLPAEPENALARAQLAAALWATTTARPAPLPVPPPEPDPAVPADAAELLGALVAPAPRGDGQAGPSPDRRPPYVDSDRTAAADTIAMPVP
ncbi:hypothetical protein F5972_08735 [Microbispora cellulosiformans]|uniref:Uncharacterized protein n=1 Tax=Microbispora cellulosiformans TaxID=2614688 RepID=A0A5J5K5B9_9ACTN|nr:hypothetical protein [Microbispora cellulosiformans]KAA9379726.1 hypothetical protein F5972_08735 [Microbispora cellulosiformans]